MFKSRLLTLSFSHGPSLRVPWSTDGNVAYNLAEPPYNRTEPAYNPAAPQYNPTEPQYTLLNPNITLLRPNITFLNPNITLLNFSHLTEIQLIGLVSQ